MLRNEYKLGNCVRIDFTFIPTTITSLQLPCQNGLGDNGVKYLTQNYPNLSDLKLFFNSITNDNVKVLATHTGLTSLRLGSNLITEASMDALVTNTNITSLNLSCNDIKTAGAETLSTSTVLKQLTLDDCKIRSRGIEALAKNESIHSLTVTRTDINQPAIDALKQNTTLTGLALFGIDGLSQKNYQEMQQHVQENGINLKAKEKAAQHHFSIFGTLMATIKKQQRDDQRASIKNSR